MNFAPLTSRRNYPFDPALHFGFEELNLKSQGTLCISITERNYLKEISGKKFYIHLEEPNSFWAPDLRFQEGTFDQVFSICKFTTSFFDREMNNKGKYVFFPTNFKFVPEIGEKPFDLVYSGHLRHKSVIKTLTKLKEHGLRLCVISDFSHPLVTHKGVDYLGKMKLIAASKFSLVFNQLFVTRKQRYLLEMGFPEYRLHPAFYHFKREALIRVEDNSLKLPNWLRYPHLLANFVEQKKLLNRDLANYLEGIWSSVEIERVPQLKSRLFESTACGTIPIVIKDPWNLASDWFTSEEFIHLQENEVSELVSNELSKYSTYRALSFHLREKTERLYSSKAFAAKYLTGL